MSEPALVSPVENARRAARESDHQTTNGRKGKTMYVLIHEPTGYVISQHRYLRRAATKLKKAVDNMRTASWGKQDMADFIMRIRHENGDELSAQENKVVNDIVLGVHPKTCWLCGAVVISKNERGYYGKA